MTDIEESFEEMTKDINRYVGDIETLTSEKVQTRTELDVARKIQCGIVPLEHSVSGNGYEGYGIENPTREVGGDFYDIFNLDDERVCAIVGDTSGKGISAAMFMVMVETALRENLKAGRSLADAFDLVNKEICLTNPENMFVTVFATVLHTGTGVLKYVSAGHEAPLVLKESPSFLAMKSGMALGLFEDSKVLEEEILLHDGEGILIYTDGIPEAINRNREQYGKEHLKETVSGRYPCDACAMVSGIIDSVNAFAEGTEQFDDITCAALIFRDHHDAGSTLAPAITSFATVRQAILSSLGESEKTKTMILACEEIFANIVSYSGADKIRFACERKEDLYTVTFFDNGVPFDPVRATPPDKDFEDLDTGGMGIRLARLYSKEMVYNRVDGKNVLTLKFDAGS